MKLLNAQILAKENPKTFQVPEKKEIDKITLHDLIKVSNGKERFWCAVYGIITNSINEKKFCCTIENKLLFTENSLKMKIEILPENIYRIVKNS